MTNQIQTHPSAAISKRAWTVAWLAIAAYAVVVAIMFPHRDWDADEFEHIQSAWMISLGLTPYIDYFEHHTPLWDLLASRVFGTISPDSPEAASTLIVLLRAASFACSVLIVALTWRLARRAGGLIAALLAVVLLVTNYAFLAKGIEIRPDPLALVLVPVGATSALRGLDADRQGNGPAAALAFAAAGAALCLATLATQKVLLVLPGVAAACLHLLLARGAARRILPCAAWAIAGGLTCALPMLAWFQARSGLLAFFHYNFFLNAGWERSPFLLYAFSLKYDGIFDILGLAGLGFAAWSLARGRARPEVAMAAGIMTSVIAGGFVIPVVTSQYIMFAVPFAATLAALATSSAFATIRQEWLRKLAACLAAVLLIAHAGRNGTRGLRLRDVEGQATLAYIIKTVPADQTVMGGWTPGIAFRKPAWFYYFPHDEIQAIIPQADYRKLAAGIDNGTIRPALIDNDDALRQMPADVRAAIEKRYQPAGIANLWERKPES